MGYIQYPASASSLKESKDWFADVSTEREVLII